MIAPVAGSGSWPSWIARVSNSIDASVKVSYVRSAMFRGLGVLGAVCLAACALAAGDGWTNSRTTTMMTIKLKQGCELEHVVVACYANKAEAMPAAVSTDYAMVVGTNFPVRARALAQQIVSAHADLVGLQEVATWSV